MVDVYILNLLAIGLLLLFATLGSGFISRRLPLSYAIIYLAVGIIIGPYGFNLIQLRQTEVFSINLLERLTEFVVIVSVFGCGLKIIRPFKLAAWDITIRLIGIVMPISIFALAAVAKFAINLDWGSAILLGAILSPTDPVLASEVQLKDTKDENELRFGLTSEGGLNDALAFPFVYFGIYASKDSNWNNWLHSWVGIDVIWAIIAGIVTGFIVSKVIVWLDRKIQQYHPIDDLMEDFIALSTILLTYSITEVVNGYGFLAVFVAGLVLQRSYKSSEKPLAQLQFIERVEKLLEVGTIVILGSILLFQPIMDYAFGSLVVSVSLLFIIRPLSVWISTIGKRFVYPQRKNFQPVNRLLFSWFGIRGIGSLYYLSYALGHGVEGEPAQQISWITYTTVIASITLHGITATPLMNWYNKHHADRPEVNSPTKADNK
ncbi:cation:proton antiporter [Mastigocoleus testarum]|uniref:Sodium:proton exchanger n=1 Tax=Mastigocoleus testarum BC008 TaxID=371196 RepID=A0A0V7ZGH8_9CYAN|nr:sodium:proton antiporter [Mastigocoleus testarum]KST63700.1 sodium:proton exchanger [Mastigocoleus testarum BC008]KST63758.1 sodium:proton exchanger [Mastigocoleus testarum BC008]